MLNCCYSRWFACGTYLMFGATLLYSLRMSRFIIKFWGDLANQPGSVVV